MDIRAAYKILKLEFNSSKEEVLDAYDFEVFAIKKKFLQVILHPSLVKKHFEQIENLNSAVLAIIESQEIAQKSAHEILPNSHDIDHLVPDYIKKFNSLRSKISNSSFTELSGAIKEFEETGIRYISELSKFISKVEPIDVKMTDYPNEMDLVNDAKANGLQGVLVQKEINRAYKIVSSKEQNN